MSLNLIFATNAPSSETTSSNQENFADIKHFTHPCNVNEIIQEPKHTFSIFLPDNMTGSDEKSDHAFFHFFNPQYYRWKGWMFLFTLNMDEAKREELKKNIEAHYINNMLIYNVDDWAPDKIYIISLNGNNQIFQSKEAFLEYYPYYLTQQYNPSDVLLIGYNHTSEQANIEDKIRNLTDSVLYEMQFKFMEVYQHHRSLTLKNVKTEEELLITKQLLTLLSNSNETKNILNFYHKEYEVLPLWYKRFGHLIKILIGKRKIK